MKLVVVTGLSGAGKTQALHTLEDIGFYCVDNLPPVLIPEMARLALDKRIPMQKLALGIDSRSGVLFSDADEAMDRLRELGIRFDVLFLNASDQELIRRYKETRRAHPMGSDSMLIQNIQKEREMLRGMEKRATRVIDTTAMLTRQLRELLLRAYGDEEPDKAITLHVLSFGFKHGLPQDADLVLDVRFIPNPYYVPEMRGMTGTDKPVREYVLSFPETKEFLEKTMDWLNFLIPHYVSEGKDRLVIGVGCTGGQHRSVCLAAEIAGRLKAEGFRCTVSHRDSPESETKV